MLPLFGASVSMNHVRFTTEVPVVCISAGRSGTVGVLLDDLVDVCKALHGHRQLAFMLGPDPAQDLESSEFKKFRQCNARPAPFRYEV